MQGEYAFHAFTVGNFADGESFIDAGTALGDHNALENLDTFLAAFNNTSVNLDGITYVKWGHIRLELLLLDFVDNVHLLLSIAGEYQ